MGTIVNVMAILAGGTAGIFFQRSVRQSMMDMLLKVEGAALFVIALNGLISAMFTVSPDGKLENEGGMLLLLSMVIGAFVGELLKLDDRFNAFGQKVETKLGATGFSKGFIAASLVFCIGSMAIMGPLEEGINGDPNMLLVKSVLDGVTAVVLASTLGWGVMASSVPVLLYQGAITVFARLLAPFLDTEGTLINDFSMVGYGIILCIAFNFVTDAKIKTANLLPALLIPILYNLFLMF